jgi:hypothetical protein
MLKKIIILTSQKGDTKTTLGGTDMPISANSPINFAKIAAEMSVTTERWMNATIEIVDPNLEDLVWDEWTNTSVGAEIVLWQGKARVQQVATETRDPNGGFAILSNRRVRFQVPKDDTRGFVRAGLVVRVTDGGEFSDLEKIDFNVSSAINSSYAWLLTIECEADTKSKIDSGS